MSKNVALVLSSGGPRGFAYIGAIEELERRGYKITSVSGCSVGSLIGGVYAAGGLEDFKRWLYSLDNIKMLRLLDVSISRSYLVRGERLMAKIKSIVPEVNIEDMAIPYAAVAADLYTGEQVVFREGPLFDAIRASISIPSMFRPVKWRHRTLVDGGIVNTFPLDLVKRTPGDILVGFDVNDIDSSSINTFLEDRKTISESGKDITEEASEVLSSGKGLSLLDKVRMVGDIGERIIKERREKGAEEKRLLLHGRAAHLPISADDSYFSILDRCFSITNHVIAKLDAQVLPPDVLVKMPLDAYSSLTDYVKGEEIAEKGRALMAEALDRYESA